MICFLPKMSDKALYRYFRQKGLFYERREGEWQQLVTYHAGEARAVYKAEGYEPTCPNYFKNQSYGAKILNAPIPGKLTKLAQKALQTK